jgi:hypothetical protein
MRIGYISVLALGVIQGGCATHDGLRREIASLEQRLGETEAGVETATTSIGAPGKAVNVQLGYRPIVAWANTFSERPADQRTIRFRQSQRDGDLYSVKHECYWDWGWHRRDGKRAWVHESGSTKIDVEMRKLTVVPHDSGLRLEAPMAIDGKTQVGFNYRPACLPSVGGNIGVTAKATPEAVFELRLKSTDDGGIKYDMVLVSPSSIGLEMRADFNYFRVGFTIPVKSLAQTLGSGDVSMLLGKEGEVVFPDGTRRPYRIKTMAPEFSSDKNGLRLSSNIAIEFDR